MKIPLHIEATILRLGGQRELDGIKKLYRRVKSIGMSDEMFQVFLLRALKKRKAVGKKDPFAVTEK